ncbi:hypothetical protein [Provencibacterium massiliense]|uniref:hypothetical protein n=1 Tax=Provencibacterium massiliense TaxID=1841868 RepID=UPI0009A84B3E|nr:hypothetical protein [Provencibacterium massiliense]
MILSLPSAELYYERSGAGSAVVLLHGNGEDHTGLIARSIPKVSLRILPGETHGSYIVHSRKVYDLLRPFFQKYIGQER